MAEYIEKNKAMKEVDDVEKIFPYDVSGDLDTYRDYNKGWSDACDMIFGVLFNMEKEDVEHVVHAQWIGIEGDGYDDDGNIVYDVFECSKCGCEHRADGEPEWTYCPDCGAKMDLED